jgi:hypothetical protein
MARRDSGCTSLGTMALANSPIESYSIVRNRFGPGRDWNRQPKIDEGMRPAQPHPLSFSRTFPAFSSDQPGEGLFRCSIPFTIPARPSVCSPAHEAPVNLPFTGPRAAALTRLFSDAWPRPPPKTLRERSHGRVHFRPLHSRIAASARFARPPFREHLRAGFPALLVTFGA